MKMFITKKHLSRRTVLQGMGAIVSLPLLEAMIPAQTRLSKTAATSKSRFTCIEVVHGDAGSTHYGTEQNLRMPKTEGANFEFTKILKPLEPFRDDLTVVSMLDCHPADPFAPEEVGADHFRSSAVFLTGSHPKQTMGSDIYCGTSVDQIYAQKFGQDTPLPSIQLQSENEDSTGACFYNYSCVYMNTISWATPTSPLPMTYNPRMAFEELFGSGGSEAERAERRKINRSILDGLVHNIASLKKGLSASDRSRVDAYLENVREIERRIQAIEAYNSSGAKRELPNAPIGVPDSWDEHVKLMLDLQVLAFSAEVTRVSTMKFSRDVSNRVFAESGSTTAFHVASHHASAPKSIEALAVINTYHHKLVAYFADKLKNTPDGDGNLLDHSLVFYGSSMGDSNVHAHKRVPFLLLGHANGAVKGNLHLKAAEGTPQSNALLTVLQKLGVDIEQFGDSTGTISI
jgi:hypothetical protein